jgi:hypothetical protein
MTEPEALITFTNRIFANSPPELMPAFTERLFIDVNSLSGQKKHRRIFVPNETMRIVHTPLLTYLRRYRKLYTHATGALPGSSPLKNVERHREGGHRGLANSPYSFNRYFFLADIRDAYASVDLGLLAVSLSTLSPRIFGTPEEARLFLKKYCSVETTGGLAVGSPTSPDLFNLYCAIYLDRQLAAICDKHGITYTRYLDDLTFSAAQPIGIKKRRSLLQAVRQAGFTLSDHKCKVYDRVKGPVVINGVGIKRNSDVFLPRHALGKLRGLLHLALKGSPISPSLIAGHMGSFVSLQRTHSRYRYPPRCEFEVVELYRRWQKYRKTLWS